jgi:hypothetical protein
MKRIGIVCLAIVLIISLSAGAKTIKLKNGFFTGWQFSVDGNKFNKVGMSGDKLASEMEGNEPASTEMSKYKSNKTTATIIGVPAGFLIGWPIGGSLGGGWREEYGYMLGAGGALAVISFVLEASSTSHLKKAVRIFNGEEPGLKVEINCLRNHAIKKSGAEATLSWRF